jgi:hypothetical protein
VRQAVAFRGDVAVDVGVNHAGILTEAGAR